MGRSRATITLILIAVGGATLVWLAWPWICLLVITRTHISHFPDGAVQMRCRLLRWDAGNGSGAMLFPSAGELLYLTAGKMHGPYVWYWPDGHSRLAGEWFRGDPIGRWRRWDEKGRLVHEIDFERAGVEGKVVARE